MVLGSKRHQLNKRYKETFYEPRVQISNTTTIITEKYPQTSHLFLPGDAIAGRSNSDVTSGCQNSMKEERSPQEESPSPGLFRRQHQIIVDFRQV